MEVEMCDGFERLLLSGRAGFGSPVSSLAITAELANALRNAAVNLTCGEMTAE
jgi:hypothetical protein